MTYIPTYTIIQADGLYDNNDDEIETFPYTEGDTPYRVKHVQTNLSPGDSATCRPWTDIDESLREQVDGIMILKLGMTAADIALFPRLKVVVRMGVGYDRVDRTALAKRGITLCNIPDYGTGEIADHALALALSLRRGIILHHDGQRAAPPSPWTPITTPLISRIQHATFGILGLGLVGTAVALRAKAFGWNVLIYDPYAPRGIERSLGVSRTHDIRELFRRSTTLSVHCPLTAQTGNLVSRDLLALLPPSAILINTARGEVVDLDAVAEGLRTGRLAGVGLDVVPGEPLAAEGPLHPLLKAYRAREPWLVGRLVVTPHCAYHSPESILDIRRKSAETMRDVLLKGLRFNVVEPSRG